MEIIFTYIILVMALFLHRNFDIFIRLSIPFLCHQVLFGYFLYISEGTSDIS